MLDITGLMGNQDRPPSRADVCVLQLQLQPRVEPERIICAEESLGHRRNQLKSDLKRGGWGRLGFPHCSGPRPRGSGAPSLGAAEPPGLRCLMSRSPARPVSVEKTRPPLTPGPR